MGVYTGFLWGEDTSVVMKKFKKKGRPKSRPGPKFMTPLEKEEVLAEVAKLEMRGYAQWEIAQKIGVSQPQVCLYVAKIRERYLAIQLGETKEYIAEKLAQYADMRKVAFEALERSALDRLRVEVEQRSNPYGASKSKRKVREGRLPAAEYMRIIMETYEAERKLLGLDSPQKVDLRSMTIDWDKLAQGATAPGAGRDNVEARIQAALGGSTTTATVAATNGDSGNH